LSGGGQVFSAGSVTITHRSATPTHVVAVRANHRPDRGKRRTIARHATAKRRGIERSGCATASQPRTGRARLEVELRIAKHVAGPGSGRVGRAPWARSKAGGNRRRDGWGRCRGHRDPIEPAIDYLFLNLGQEVVCSEHDVGRGQRKAKVIDDQIAKPARATAAVFTQVVGVVFGLRQAIDRDQPAPRRTTRDGSRSRTRSAARATGRARTTRGTRSRQASGALTGLVATSERARTTRAAVAGRAVRKNL
jgi:hypothetical protein